MKKTSRLVKNMLVAGFLAMFFSLFFSFPAGAFSSKLVTEQNAEYIADVAKKNKDAEYVNFLIEPVDETKNPLSTPSRDFYSLYSIFNILENKCTFAGTGNANKEHDLRIKEFGDCDNLSILYAEMNTSIEYNGHWKHNYYPLELMFRGNYARYSEAYSFCCISKSHAEKLLDIEGKEHTEENFASLIGQRNITLTCDDSDYSYTIANIYLENNYFERGLRNVMGDFILTYLNLPGKIKKQASFFLNSHKFQNEFYMDYMRSNFDSKKFEVKINTLNLKNVDSARAVKFFSVSKKTDTLSSLFVVLSFVLCLVSIVVFSNNFIPFDKKYFIPFVCILFTPYFLFKIISSLSKKVLMFSSFSTILNLILSSIYIIFFIILFIAKKRRLRKNNKRFNKMVAYDTFDI